MKVFLIKLFNIFKTKKKNIIKKNFEYLDQLVFDKKKNFYLNIIFEKINETLNLYIQFKGKDLPIIVNFHGAVNQHKTIMPHFTGTTMSKFVNCNFISISDPSLKISKNLTRGWYIGSKNFDLIKVLPDVLKKIQEIFKSKKIILFGSSGGGFGALYYSQIIGCECIVNSPCTTLVKHPNPKSVEYSMCKIFSLSNKNQVYEILNEKNADLNLNYKIKNRLKIFINENDNRVLKFFLYPFWNQYGISMPNEQFKSFNINGKELKIIKFKNRTQHVYPPLSMLIEEFNKSIKS